MTTQIVNKIMEISNFDSEQSISNFYGYITGVKSQEILIYEDSLFILVIVKLKLLTKLRMLLSSNFRAYMEYILRQPERGVSEGMNLKVVITL